MTDNIPATLIEDEPSEASLHYYSESDIAKLRELTTLGWTDQAMFLKSQGLSCYRVGKQLGLSNGLIQCWSRREEALND